MSHSASWLMGLESFLGGISLLFSCFLIFH